MASTTPIAQPQQMGAQDVICNSLAASTTIPMGCLAVNDSGVAKNFTDTLYQGGAKLLGVAMATMENPVASTATKRMLFQRACMVKLAGKAGDLPTAASIGGTVYLSDNNTCKATDAGSDCPVVLVKIEGSVYFVRLP